MRICVVGDVGIDKSVECSIVKVCSEAPIPVFHETNTKYNLAMAANVATMCRALGAEVLLCGVSGYDSSAGILFQLMKQAGIDNGVVKHACNTTIKTRYFDSNRILFARIDRDCKYVCTLNDASQILNTVEQWKPNAIIIQDHGKGVITHELLHQITQGFYNIFIDPCKNTPTPAKPLTWLSSIEELPSPINTTEHCVIQKYGQGGVSCNFPKFSLPAYNKRPIKTVGAGDQFLAAFVIEYASGGALKQACHVASIAAAIQCSKELMIPVTQGEIASSLYSSASACTTI